MVTGHVRTWEAGARFVVTWEISADWKSDPRAAFASEVDVRFLPEAGGRTRVELEHRNFERMGDGGGRHDAQGRRRRLAGAARSIRQGGRSRMS